MDTRAFLAGQVPLARPRDGARRAVKFVSLHSVHHDRAAPAARVTSPVNHPGAAGVSARMEHDLEAILIPLSFFLLVGFVLWQGRKRAEHETQRRFELGVRTLERFSDPEALDRFLSGVAGQEFLRMLDSGEAPLHRRLLRSVQGGMVLAGLGLAFLVLAAVNLDNRQMVIPGTLLVCLGGALLAGAAVTRSLSKRWDILGEGRVRGRTPASPYREEASS